MAEITSIREVNVNNKNYFYFTNNIHFWFLAIEEI